MKTDKIKSLKPWWFFIKYSIWKKILCHNFTKGYVKVNDINLYYEKYGTGKPLLLLHGGSSSLESFMCQAAFFAKKYRVIAVDTRGHGRSSDSNEDFTYNLFASDILDFLKKMNITSTTILGWSDGGITALEIMLKSPKLIDKLIVTGINLNSDGLNKDFFEIVKKSSSKNWIEPIAVEVYKKISPTPNNVENFISKVKKLWLSDFDIPLERLNKIKTPVCIIAGRNEECIKIEHLKQIANNIKNSELHLINNSGHSCLLEKGKRFNKICERFLN